MGAWAGEFQVWVWLSGRGSKSCAVSLQKPDQFETDCSSGFLSLYSPVLNRWVAPSQEDHPSVLSAGCFFFWQAASPQRCPGESRMPWVKEMKGLAHQGNFKGQWFSLDLQNKSLGTLMRCQCSGIYRVSCTSMYNQVQPFHSLWVVFNCWQGAGLSGFLWCGFTQK